MKIAIFNGFPFHYEMFGYILYYCKCKNFNVTIYSTDENYGWNMFYKNIFFNIEWKPYIFFEYEYNKYNLIFLATDDDYNFSNKIIERKKNIICIDHLYLHRKNNIDMFYHIAVRPFITNYRKWALPCYPIVTNVQEKKQLLEENVGVHIAIIGGDNIHNYNILLINRLTSLSKITLHFISRQINKIILQMLDKKFNICIYENIQTHEMMDILKKTKYVATDMTLYPSHLNGYSMSGSIPLAFSMLNQLIISSKNNDLYKFRSSIIFDINSDSDIEINNNIDEQCIQNIYEERNILINQFHNYIDEYIK